MAKNAEKGKGRVGAVKGRSQTDSNPLTGKFTKRDTSTGQFIDQKADDKPFKGVRKER